MGPRSTATAVPTILLRRLVKPTSPAAAQGLTRLSPIDSQHLSCRVSSSWGFVGERLDADVLERALAACLDDLPMLAGRVACLKPGASLLTLRLKDWCISHNGEGAELTVAELKSATVADLMDTSARLWHEPKPATDMGIPCYVEQSSPPFVPSNTIDTRPLLFIRLTRVADGDILAMTFSHAVADGAHLLALARHLGARYREAAGGAPAAPSELLSSAGDRGVFTRVGIRVVDLAILHVPIAGVAALKQLAAGGPGAADRSSTISTGDAVQAACMLLVAAATKRPPLPVAPAAAAGILLQLPKPPGFLGNAVHLAAVALPAGTPQPAAGDHVGALRTLAAAVRATIDDCRAHPDKIVDKAQGLVSATLPHILFNAPCDNLFMVANYIPWQTSVDLGMGIIPQFTQIFVRPRPAQGAWALAATPPYEEGLVIQLPLAPAEIQRLQKHELLTALLPTAQWVKHKEQPLPAAGSQKRRSD